MKQGFYLYNESIEEVAIKCRRHSSLFVVKYAERIPTDDTTLWMGDLLGCTICWINWKIKSKLQACVILNNNSIWIYKILISVISDNLTQFFFKYSNIELFCYFLQTMLISQANIILTELSFALNTLIKSLK